MDFVIKKRTLLTIFYLLFYRLVLDYVYVFVVSPIFSYSGLSLNINPTKLFISYVVMIGVSLVMDRKNEKVSSIILQYHFLVMIVPLLSFYSLNNKTSVFLAMSISCFALEIFLVKTLPNFKIRKIKDTEFVLFILLPILLIVVVIFQIKTYGLSLEALDFTKIYDIRSDQISTVGILSYFWTWCYRIINPFLIIAFYWKNKKIQMYFFVFLQVIMYFISPHKEILFAIMWKIIVTRK